MADTIARLILGLVQAVFEVLLAITGRKALSFFGRRKSNLITETLVGLMVWGVVGIAAAVVLN
jgi:hypothetical protein